eukprot:GILI01010454.1.p1 GENE.GILI01010454.1~~GILI01010454.1.p1  ORF type:complete len:436 (+),score=32.99 GILI01010454.1:175-1482(+)
MQSSFQDAPMSTGARDSHRRGGPPTRRTHAGPADFVAVAEIADIIRPLWTAEQKLIRQHQSLQLARKRGSSVQNQSFTSAPKPSRQSQQGVDLLGGLAGDTVTSGIFDSLSPKPRKLSVNSSNPKGKRLSVSATGHVQEGTDSHQTVFIRVLIVANHIPIDSPSSTAHPSKRPTLCVNYCYSDRLCHCHTDATPLTLDEEPPLAPMPQTTQKTAAATLGSKLPSVTNIKKGGASPNPTATPQPSKLQSPASKDSFSNKPSPAAAKGLASTPIISSSVYPADKHPPSFYKGLILCDRYCNKASNCTGHKCIRSVVQHKRAPFLAWESGPHAATTMRSAKLPPYSSISASVIRDQVFTPVVTTNVENAKDRHVTPMPAIISDHLPQLRTPMKSVDQIRAPKSAESPVPSPSLVRSEQNASSAPPVLTPQLFQKVKKT